MRRPLLACVVVIGIFVAAAILIAPTLSPARTVRGDENLVFRIAPIGDHISNRVNVSYFSVIYPAGSAGGQSAAASAGRGDWWNTALTVESVDVWWYPTVQVPLAQTAALSVIADGPKQGRDWACRSDNPPRKGADPKVYYPLSAYPQRVPAGELSTSVNGASTESSAIVRVARERVPTGELVTAGVSSSPLATPTPEPAPEPSPTPVTVTVTGPAPTLPDGREPGSLPTKTVHASAPPLTDQYEIWCERVSPSTGNDEGKEAVSVPDITVVDDAASTIDAEGSAYFESNRNITSPIQHSSGNVDISTPGRVRFTYHTDETMPQTSAPVLGGSFVVSDPAAAESASFRQQIGFLILGAWLAVIVGLIPPSVLNPWRQKKNSQARVGAGGSQQRPHRGRS